MSFLLDTSVISEWIEPHPDPGVVEWLAEADEDRLFLSVVTLAEMRHGIERLEAGRRTRLDAWLRDELPLRFEHRLLSIDPAIAGAWGTLVAARGAARRPIHVMDAFIAATAIVHGLTVVTRNAGDFAGSVETINPWTIGRP